MSKAEMNWQERLDFLLAEEALTEGAAKWALRKKIEEAQARLREIGEEEAGPSQPPVSPPPPRLPFRPPRCFGRELEVEALVAALCAQRPSPTSLHGGPGMGKSTISLEALHDARVAERFGARRYFVRLEAAATAEAMVRELARGAGVEEKAGGGDLLSRVLVELEREPAVLVLDNLETPWWAEQAAVEELLSRLGGVASLALAVSLRGGRRPLKIRWGKKIEVGVLPPEAARRTFLEIAGEELEGDPQLDGLLGKLFHATGLGGPALLERAKHAARKAKDMQREADCIQRLGDIALYRSDHAEARSRYEQALPLYQRVSDLLGAANCIQRLGHIALRRSEYDEARSRYEQALPHHQHVEDLLGEANCIQGLGEIGLCRSELAEAHSRYEQALLLYQRVADLLGSNKSATQGIAAPGGGGRDARRGATAGG